jgi:hypothetical protein
MGSSDGSMPTPEQPAGGAGAQGTGPGLCGHRRRALAVHGRVVKRPGDVTEVVVQTQVAWSRSGHRQRPWVRRSIGRGRDGDCSPPPAQIPACGATALGSYLGSGRRSA